MSRSQIAGRAALGQTLCPGSRRPDRTTLRLALATNYKLQAGSCRMPWRRSLIHHRVGVLNPAVDPAEPPVEMGRAGPEADPGAIEPEAAKFRREPRGRQRGRRPQKGGAPDTRGDCTERNLVEGLGRRG
jgi:hypothetical protein